MRARSAPTSSPVKPATRVAAAIAALLALAPPARADTAAGAPALAAPAELAVLTVTFEGTAWPGVAFALRDGSDLLLDTDTLARLGIRFDPSNARRVDDRSLVPLATIRGLRWKIVEQEQRLVLSLDPASQPLSNIPFGYEQAPRPLTPDWGGFVNYGVYSTPSLDGTRLGGAANTLGGSLGGSIFGPYGIGSATALVNPTTGAEGTPASVVVLDVNWRWDDLSGLRTLQVGDAIAAPGWWGQAVRFGGVQFSSNYALQPGFITYPLLAVGGLATVPSTTEILINDVRVGTQNVPTGPFSITNIPTISGAGELNLVVRDAFGQQRVISQPFYIAQQLLRPGLTEFSVGAGAERRNYGVTNFDYGQGYAFGYVRRGLTDNFTAEARAEIDSNIAAAGLGGDVLIGQIGVVSAGATLSQVDGRMGAKYLVGFDRQGRTLSFGARATRATEQYAEIGEPLPRVSSSSTAFFRAPLGEFGSIGMAYTGQRYFNSHPVNVATATFSRNLIGNAYLTLSFTRYTSGTQQTQALALVTLPLDPLTSATGSAQRTTNDGKVEKRAEALVQRAMPIGEGYGYYLRANTDRLVAGGASYANAYGRYSLEASQSEGTTALRAAVTGAVAWIGKDFVVGQSIDQGFAMVRVADLGDVRVLQENQEVGRTRGGRLALTQIPPLNPVKIAVDPLSVPMDMALEGVVREVTLLPRTGVLVDFKPTRERSALVKLVLPSGEPVPAGATVTIDGRAETFTVGYDGEAYLTRLANRQVITVRYEEGACRLAVIIEGDAAHSNVGPLVCASPREGERNK